MPFSLSFEFFPPKSGEGAARLRRAYMKLAQLRPEFFSVTYGAGGSTRERTLETALEIREATGIDV
ncbi:MAG: methylenetetrahydrofolate reductase [NAD(P)H], partial [Gammaproteobacteria bacterium]